MWYIVPDPVLSRPSSSSKSAKGSRCKRYHVSLARYEIWDALARVNRRLDSMLPLVISRVTFTPLHGVLVQFGMPLMPTDTSFTSYSNMMRLLMSNLVG